MNRKIRTAIAALAALTVAFAIAPVASAAPVLPPTDPGEIATVAPTDGGTSARPNDGRYSRTEAKKPKNYLCSILKLIYDTSMDEAGAEYVAGNDKAADETVDTAVKAADDAKKQGCGWAA